MCAAFSSVPRIYVGELLPPNWTEFNPDYHLKEVVQGPPFYPSCQLISELSVAKHFSHPGIVSPEFIYIDSDPVAETVTYQLICPRGVPHRPGDPISDQDIWELIDTLSWLEEQGLCHGDVKIDNLLRLPDGRLKLIDFGLMYRPWWKAPQTTQSYSKSHCRSFPAQINAYFALGVTVALLVLTPPFSRRLTKFDLVDLELKPEELVKQLPQKWQGMVQRLLSHPLLPGDPPHGGIVSQPPGCFRELLPEDWIPRAGTVYHHPPSETKVPLHWYRLVATNPYDLTTSALVVELAPVISTLLQGAEMEEKLVLELAFVVAAGVHSCPRYMVEPVSAEAITLLPKILANLDLLEAGKPPFFVSQWGWPPSPSNSLELLWRAAGGPERWHGGAQEIFPMPEEGMDLATTILEIVPDLTHFISFDGASVELKILASLPQEEEEEEGLEDEEEEETPPASEEDDS